MKRLNKGNGGPKWEGDMVGNLSFIKKNLRYPINKYNSLPLWLLSTLLPLVCLLVYTSAAQKYEQHQQRAAPIIGLSCMLLAGIILFRRYWQTLHFISIPTPYFNTDNQLILLRFLKAHHLAYARHPQAPEVFQIMSKSISALKEERELVVFIADDRRILINSHFTQTGTNFAIGIPHHQQMAKLLQRWLNAGGNPGNTSLERSIF